MSTTIPDYAWRKFARFTVQTGDLDPMYDFIYRARLGRGTAWAEKFALGFFLFYDAGEAAKIANDNDFWDIVNSYYHEFKRGTERRHFRGDKGLEAIRNLMSMGEPHDIWTLMHEENFTKLEHNLLNQFSHCQIGPYFIWKAMDILDRGLGMPVVCSVGEAIAGMPNEPKEAARYFFPHLTLQEVLLMIVNEIEDNNAPGEPNRKCSYPEAETILCMMKGYFKTKTHVIGDDVEEKHRQLESARMGHLRKYLPPQLIWRSYERAMESPTLPDDSVGVRAQE